MAVKGKEAVQEALKFTDEQMGNLSKTMSEILKEAVLTTGPALSKERIFDLVLEIEGYTDRQKVAIAFLLGEFVTQVVGGEIQKGDSW